jgi:hypothetical protein
LCQAKHDQAPHAHVDGEVGIHDGTTIAVGRGTYLLYLRDMKSLATLVATAKAKKPIDSSPTHWTPRMAMFLNIST